MPGEDRATPRAPSAQGWDNATTTTTPRATDNQSNDASGRVGCRPFLWNPQDPNQLFLPSILTASTGDDATATKGSGPAIVAPAAGKHQLEYEVALAEGGADCNDYELLALTRILEAHASYHNRRREAGGPPPTPGRGSQGGPAGSPFFQIQALLEQYVVSIRDCLQGWDADIRRRNNMVVPKGAADEDGMDVEPHPFTPDAYERDLHDDVNNLSMLRYMYGIVSLSHTYLPLVSPLSPILGGTGVKPWDYPGLVSADMVRFLRGTYPLMSETRRVPGGVTHDESDGTPTPIDWELVRSFVLCGMLDSAWECLRRDPMYIKAKW